VRRYLTAPTGKRAVIREGVLCSKKCGIVREDGDADKQILVQVNLD
jgi:hypothetical protein